MRGNSSCTCWDRSTASRPSATCSTSVAGVTGSGCGGRSPPSSHGDEALLDLLVVATDVYTWKLLRLDRGLGARATRAAMVELCEAVAAR